MSMYQGNETSATPGATSTPILRVHHLSRGAQFVAIVVLTSTLSACGKSSDQSTDSATSAEPAAPTSATITKVEAIKETYQQPREVCQDVVITEQAEVKDSKQVGGSVAGAAVGGIIGNQVGSGRGKTVATVAGAAAGGYVGNKAQERHQQGKTTERTERQCNTVTDTQERVTGYLVTYTLDDTTATIKMDQAPSGSTLPVVDGKVAL